MSGALVAGKGSGKPGGGGGSPSADLEIAFSLSTYSGGVYRSAAVNLMDAEGGNRMTLVDDAGRPGWSPDGSSVVFQDQDGIHVIDVDGSNLRTIVGSGIGPAWSPVATADGGFKIAFLDAAPEPGRIDLDIFLIAPDGTGGVQRLTNTPGLVEESLSWSPEADRLVVTAIVLPVADRTRDLLVLNLDVDGGSLIVASMINLTSEEDVPGGALNDWYIDGSAAWARTQDRIVVGARPAATSFADQDIWMIDLSDVANPTNLTNTPGSLESWPDWSPDDSRIVFRSTSGIAAMDIDGANAATLFTDSERQRGGPPAWRRNP